MGSWSEPSARTMVLEIQPRPLGSLGRRTWNQSLAGVRPVNVSCVPLFTRAATGAPVEGKARMIAFSVAVPVISAGVGVSTTATGGGGGSVGAVVGRRVGARVGVSVADAVRNDTSSMNWQASPKKSRAAKAKRRNRFIVTKL